MSCSKVVLSTVLLASTAGIALGFWKSWTFEATPGRTAAYAAKWPTNCSLLRTPALPILVIALHPNCPCSRATIAELVKLQTRYPGKLKVDVLFVRPTGFTQDWVTTDLWRDATGIPGVQAISDDQQIAVTQFGAETSGQVFLYDGAGQLQFHGGITACRGNIGDNDGRTSIESFIDTGRVTIDHTPVYGCALQ